MAEDQILIENGRVSSLFKTINGVAIVLISALLLWMASALSTMKEQVAVLVSQNNSAIELNHVKDAARDSEHARMNERISKVEEHTKNGHQ